MTEEKTYNVTLTEPEMQAVAHAMSAFFNVMTREKKSVSETQAALIMGALLKMKEACASPVVFYSRQIEVLP